METLLESRMKEAIESKKNDVTSFLWKGIKTLNSEGKYNQESQRLVDMNENELKACYEHCKKMLFNTNPKNHGRYLVLDLIEEQRDKCGIELFLRYVEQEHLLSRYEILSHINTFKKKNEEAFKKVTPVLGDMFSGLPHEYESLDLDSVIEGCLGQLGVFNKKHITRTFILKQGIWLTAEESKELIPENCTNRLEIIREHLNLKDVEKLYVNSKGLNYTQMRAMLNLKPNKKYTDLTTSQLETLRSRILFSLENTVKSHVASWERRMKEIEIVAIHNDYKL